MIKLKLMYYIMISYQRNLRPIILFILATIVRSQYLPINPYSFCPNYGNYTNNSTYQANLNTLISFLPTNIDNNGFYNASVGQNSDRVYGLALCRGDTQLDICRSCVRNASNDLVQSCQNYRQGIRWLEFCMVRYSNAPVYGWMDTSQYTVLQSRQNITTNLMYDLIDLLYYLNGQASNGSSLRKVAATNMSVSPDLGLRNIYGMVQCTPDLSRGECNACITVFSEGLRRMIVPLGASIIMPSCNFRYEVYQFYNQTRLLEFEQPVNGDNSRNNSTPRTITIIAVSVVAGLISVVLSGFFIMKMKQKPKEANKGNAGEEISMFESMQYDFGIFKSATNDFSEANKLGQGGFGTVYKGTLPNGREIAVKRLSIGSHQGDLEFKNEVMLLVKLQHRNLVRLLGFSIEKSEKLLVYEFVQNASLDAFIFDITKRSHLDWDKRYKIIGGIARGILYLHEDSRLTIIHRDLKAGNILLDGNMNPKIADFGMARLFVPDETQRSTDMIVGTYGYMAPEYAMHGQFSVKSDVFSFGVLLLEIISGQKNKCFRHGESKADLISSAWENWRQGTAANLMDPLLRVAPRKIWRCIHIGMLCVQENAADRPTMASVIIMLNNLSLTLPVPLAPASFVHNRHDPEYLPLQNPGRPSNNSRAKSISHNEMSISGFQARNQYYILRCENHPPKPPEITKQIIDEVCSKTRNSSLCGTLLKACNGKPINNATLLSEAYRPINDAESLAVRMQGFIYKRCFYRALMAEDHKNKEEYGRCLIAYEVVPSLLVQAKDEMRKSVTPRYQNIPKFQRRYGDWSANVKRYMPQAINVLKPCETDHLKNLKGFQRVISANEKLKDFFSIISAVCDFNKK